MTRKPILFYGDPHKNWSPLYDACANYSEPGHIVVVGDLELEKPLHREICDVFDAGWSVHYILGNHDTHGCAQYQHLVDDHPSGHLGGKVTPSVAFRSLGCRAFSRLESGGLRTISDTKTAGNGCG